MAAAAALTGQPGQYVCLGEGYVGFALVYPVKVIKQAVKAIDNSKILNMM